MLRQMLEKLLGGIAIGVFSAVALFARVGDQPRLWDVMSDYFGGASAHAATGPNVVWVDAQRPTNRMLATAGSDLVPQGGAAAPAARVAAPAAASRWMRHLHGVLAFFNINGPATERSSAWAAVASGVPAAAPAAAVAAASPAPNGSLAAAKPAVADPTATAYVNYGGGSRSDIMSSASGPVYNFSGKR